MSTNVESDFRFIQLALRLARRGIGQTGSNPSVGCVIVKNSRIIARSCTAPGGRPHAETLAIKAAGNECKGATLFVTLEPCAHVGLTPSCAQSIINSKISRVVCPLTDPDPRVSGKGFAMLKNGNVTVDFIPLEKNHAEEIIQGFSSRIKKGRPYITLKLGMSLDGKIASAQGKSQWITNSALRARSHLIRLRNNAVLVGTNTFLNDNPSLNVRGNLTGFSDPLRVFLDQSLKVAPSKPILNNVVKYPSIIVCGNKPNKNHQGIWKNENVEILQINITDEGIDMNELFKVLAIKGINSLLIEGGGKLAKSLLLKSLIDKLIIHRSGVVIGDKGVPSFADFGMADQEINAFPNFKLQSFSRYDDNLETVWKLL